MNQISPGRIRTYDQSVNSRPLYRWAIKEYIILIFTKYQHCAIFPKNYFLSIFAAIKFNYHVRNGMVLFFYAKNTDIKSLT